MKRSHLDFIYAHTSLVHVPMVPEIVLHQASDDMLSDFLKRSDIPVAWWSIAWPGGQVLSRYILDHPETVKGKRVLDLATGSGVIAIAAAKAGAAKVYATDIDPIALTATKLNAMHNAVDITTRGNLNLDNPLRNIDLIVTGDICYNQAMSTKLFRWLYRCIEEGIPVLLGDPGRAFVPKEGLEELASYEIPVRRPLEDKDLRTAWVWKLAIPTQQG